MTVRELLARANSRELSEWMAFASLEPFGDARGDLQAAIVASTVANTARDPKKRRRPFAPADFVPDFDRPERRHQTWQEQLSIVTMLNTAFGGRDLRDKGN
jgi:hypothetical protein